jgi:hypothetical protein
MTLTYVDTPSTEQTNILQIANTTSYALQRAGELVVSGKATSDFKELWVAAIKVTRPKLDSDNVRYMFDRAVAAELVPKPAKKEPTPEEKFFDSLARYGNIKQADYAKFFQTVADHIKSENVTPAFRDKFTVSFLKHKTTSPKLTAEQLNAMVDSYVAGTPIDFIKRKQITATEALELRSKPVEQQTLKATPAPAPTAGNAIKNKQDGKPLPTSASFRLTESMKEELKTLAVKDRRSLAEIITFACEHYLAVRTQERRNVVNRPQTDFSPALATA